MNRFTRSFFDRGSVVRLASIMLCIGSAISAAAQSPATTPQAKPRQDSKTVLRGMPPNDVLVARLVPETWGNPTVAGERHQATQSGSVTLTPSTVDFGWQTIGEPSPPKCVTLTNNQSVSLSISQITLQYTEVFHQTNNCGTSLRPYSSCTINVVFTPKRKTGYTGYLRVWDNGPGSPQLATLMGNGDE